MRQVIYKNALQYLKGQENFYNNCINSKFIGNAVKCKMCEIFKNIYSEEHLWTTAFAPSSIANFETRYPGAVVRRCSVKKVFLKKFEKFTGKLHCQSLFLMKLQA